MAREQDRQAVLENLTSTLAAVLALGVGDLSAAKREQLDQVLAGGGRIEFVIRCAPLHVRCFVAAADLQTRTLIFEVQTHETPGPRGIN